jgi:hypothetical protein
MISQRRMRLKAATQQAFRAYLDRPCAVPNCPCVIHRQGPPQFDAVAAYLLDIQSRWGTKVLSHIPRVERWRALWVGWMCGGVRATRAPRRSTRVPLYVGAGAPRSSMAGRDDSHRGMLR